MLVCQQSDHPLCGWIFIAGYIDTDGCVSKADGSAHNAVSICSVSSEILKQCQILFSRLGINASTVAKYQVTVSEKIYVESYGNGFHHMLFILRKENVLNISVNLLFMLISVAMNPIR